MTLFVTNIASDLGLRLLLSPISANVVMRTACCSVGVVLPVYSTFRAIEREDQNEKRKWLIYWTAYGSFSVVELFADKLISWFPFYYHLKFAFLVWLQFPSSDGAKQLYMNHLRPFFLKHQAKVDELMGDVYGVMFKLASAHQAELQFAKSTLFRITGSVDRLLRGGAQLEGQESRRIMNETETVTDIAHESEHEN